MWKVGQNPAVYSADTQESSGTSSGEDQVLVRLLTSNPVSSASTQTTFGETSSAERVSNGGEVNVKASGAQTIAVSAYVLASIPVGGFRKIEPRPGTNEMRTQSQETIRVSDDQNRLPGAKRLLDINATRRGVKTCPQCLKKIGYRSKLCKYCYPGKKRSRKSRKIVKPKRVPHLQDNVPVCHSEGQEVSTVDFSSVVIGNETEVSTTEEPTQSLVHTSEEMPGGPIANEQVATVQAEHHDDASHYLSIQTDGTTSARYDSRDDNVGEEAYIRDVSKATHTITVNEKIEEGRHIQVFSTEASPSTRINSPNEKVTQQRANLQALIRNLLAQTQSKPADVKARRPGKCSFVSVKDSETLPSITTKANTVEEMNLVSSSQLSESDRLASLPDGNTKSSENGFDANSVALFLGHLAQQNNGKKKLLSPMPTGEDDSHHKELKLPSESSRKTVLIYDDSKPTKLRRIEPKVDEENTVVPSSETITSKYLERTRVKDKDTNSESRFLAGSATRRGKMQCQKCKKLIGCRSKTCKHCKFTIINDPIPQPRGNTVHQAVALQLPPFMEKSIFSVRRNKGGKDHRCFVRCEAFNEGELRASNKNVTKIFSCDFPPCVTVQELGEYPQDYVCEHAKLCNSHSYVQRAVTPLLRREKQDELPISQEIKDSINQLQDKCLAKEVSLVQVLSSESLAVVERVGANDGNTLVTDAVSFVHVRFEKSKAVTGVQLQVFCSGRPCVAWNPVFAANYESAAKTFSNLRLANCVHFAACLWATASDDSLDRDFGLYLRAVRSFSNTLSVDTGRGLSTTAENSIGHSVVD